MLYGSIAIAQIDLSSVPKVVQNACQTKYSNGEILDWYKVDDGFEAYIDEDGENKSAVFDPNGVFLYTYIIVTEDEVPQNIVKGLYAKYEDIYISEVVQLDKNSGVEYKFSIDAGEKSLLLQYDKSGKLLSIKEIKQDF